MQNMLKVFQLSGGGFEPAGRLTLYTQFPIPHTQSVDPPLFADGLRLTETNTEYG